MRTFLSSRTKERHPRTYAFLRRGYRTYARMLLATRRLDAGRRMLPDFLLIGAQKAGTTSLFSYLIQQPDVLSPFGKEFHYFSHLYHRHSDAWYRAFFPRRPDSDGRWVTGDASTTYHMDPRAPARAARLVPGAKLVFVVRDPVERTFSQYRHSVRKGFESRSFEDAIARELAEYPIEVARLLADDGYESPLLQEQAYLARSCYMDQIEAWLRHYDRDRLLVVRAEDLFAEPARTYAEVLAFLGVEQKRAVSFEAHNQHRSSVVLSAATREWLEEYFRPHNDRLAQWLGRDLGWSRRG